MFKLMKKLSSDQQGATAVEYGLILALVFLAMLGAVQSFGTSAITMWNEVSTTVNGSSSA